MHYSQFINEAGPRISEAQLSAFEKSHGITLPRQYREFMLKFNGGNLYPNEVDISGLPGSPTDVNYLLGLGLGLGLPSLDLSEWISRPELNRDVPPGHIQIGYDSVGCAYTLQLAGVDTGAVHYIDETGVYRLADSLDQFFRDRIRLVGPQS